MLTTKKRIVYLPLDERPCNYYFPLKMSKNSLIEVIAPPIEFMGRKKHPADTEKIWNWLKKNIENADGAVIAIDTLVYGGIIPSRLHHLTEKESQNLLLKLRELKLINPKVEMYAFSLIMRCPQYSSSDEEPDYYGLYGREIFELGEITDKRNKDIATIEEIEYMNQLEKKIPAKYIDDYLTRREINLKINKESLNLVNDSTLDFLVIPQDDSSVYGYTAISQQQMRAKIKEMNLEQYVYMYPGADEVGCTLIARMLNYFTEKKPLIYPRYSSAKGPNIIPAYEDRQSFESVKYQIIAAGGIVADSSHEADLVLMINSPGLKMLESNEQGNEKDGMEKNSAELILYTEYLLSIGKPTVIADIAYVNGGDFTILKMLQQNNSLYELAGYAGWNTSSNTLGTCLAQGMFYLVFGNTPSHRDFLGLRYIEDIGYSYKVRNEMIEVELPKLGLTYFKTDGIRGKASEIILSKLREFADKYMKTEEYLTEVSDCYLPWDRAFEVGLEISVNNKI